MRLDTAIGHTIQALRQDQGLTLRELSTRAHMSLGYLCEIEQCRKHPQPEIQQSIARGLGISTAELYKQISLYLEGK